jgi:hypothetical protein
MTAIGLCDGVGDTAIPPAGVGTVASGGTLRDDTTVAAIVSEWDCSATQRVLTRQFPYRRARPLRLRRDSRAPRCKLVSFGKGKMRFSGSMRYLGRVVAG